MSQPVVSAAARLLNRGVPIFNQVGCHATRTVRHSGVAVYSRGSPSICNREPSASGAHSASTGGKHDRHTTSAGHASRFCMQPTYGRSHLLSTSYYPSTRSSVLCNTTFPTVITSHRHKRCLIPPATMSAIYGTSTAGTSCRALQTYHAPSIARPWAARGVQPYKCRASSRAHMSTTSSRPLLAPVQASYQGEVIQT